MKLCSQCNYENDVNAAFCSQCGQPLNHDADNAAENALPVEPYEVSEQELFVGEKFKYYDRKWEKGGRKNGASFNVAAFFFSFAWLGYRKVYKPIFLFALAFLLIDVLLYLVKYEYPLHSFSNPIDSAIGTGVTVIMAFFGNAIYQRHVNKKIELINEMTVNETARKELFAKKGGTSWLGVFYAALIIIFVYFIPTTFIPMHHNSIEEVQYAVIEYEMESQMHEITIKDLLESTFEETNWKYADKQKDKAYVSFSGSYEGHTDIIVVFLTENDTDTIFISEIWIDGQEVYFDDETEKLDFLLNFGY